MNLHAITARHWVLLAYIALCLPYAFATPIFEKNDESEHFAVAWHIAQGKGLPVQQPNTKETPWAQEGSQPPLYYALASLPLRWFDVSDFETLLVPNASPHYAPFSLNNNNRFVITPNKRAFNYAGTALAAVVLRLLNIVPGCVVVWFAYSVAFSLGNNRTTALWGMALTAFNPMFLTVTTAVSNDALVIAFVTVALSLLLRNMREGWTWRKAAVMGLLIGLASLSKLSGALLLPIVLFSIVLAPDLANKPGFLKKTGLLVVVLCLCWAAIAGWWFVRNWLLYGEPTGTAMMAEIARPRQLSLIEALGEFQGFRWSYFGIFGQFAVAAHGWVYRIWDVFLLICGLGLIYRIISRWRGLALSSGVALVALHIAVTAISILRWTMMTTASQGRLLFTCIAGISAFLAIGIQQIGDWRLAIRALRINRQSPITNRQSPIANLFVFVLAALAALIPFLTIAPAYAPPLVAGLPPNANAVQQNMPPYAEIIGYSMMPTHVKPGETVRVQVYTRAVTPTQFSYLLVAKLYGPGAQELVRFNTYSGNGLWPSNFWRAGDVMRDDIEFTVPLTVPAPGMLRAQFELYNPGSGDIVQSVSANGKTGASLFDGTTLLSGSAITQTQALAQFGNFARLVGYRIVRSANGSAIQLNWQPQNAADKDYTVFVHVLNMDGSPAFQSDSPPLQGEFPTSRWQPSAIFTDPHPFTLPADFKPGAYRLQVGFYDLTTGARTEARNANGERLKDDAFEGQIEIAK